MILACNGLYKAFADHVILENASFHVEANEKAAVVGVNGAGKSTLLKILVGELAPDSGQVTLSKGASMGYLAQHQDLNSEHTIYEALLSVKQELLDLESHMRRLELSMKHAAGRELEEQMELYSRFSHEFEQKNGYALRSELTGVLKGLGFSEKDFGRPVNQLSGGQKTRVSLGKLLLSRPDVILLDEPTNHLDLNSIAWLETFLQNYPGSVIVVSHDRYFLDRVVTKVIEIDCHRTAVYSGNYSAYAEKKAQRMAALEQQYLNQQREIRHQEAVIEKLRSFNREKSIKRAESREKMLEKMQVLEKPQTDSAAIHMTLEPAVTSGNDVLSIRGLSKSFGPLNLFSDVDLDVRRGERVAVIGDNGTGKTTLLKILNGVLLPDSGSVTLGSKVQIGYYDQEHQVLHMEKTLFEELSDAYPDMTNTEIRNILAAFLFTGDDVFKRIGDLSGGERGRVSLAKLMLSEANFLILDEPTNHLDMMSKEILEQALCRYTGTVLYVSHDRYFINKTATRILELTGRTFINYIGNYDYYLEKKEVLTRAALGSSGIPEEKAETASAGNLDWKQQKEAQARLRKRQNDLKRTEEKISELESQDEAINEMLTREEIFSDPARLMELNQEKSQIQKSLEELYARWEILAEEEESE